MGVVSLTDEDQALVERVTKHWRCAEDREHKRFREHAGEFYGLYRGLQDFRREYRDAPDRDVRHAAEDEYGPELFIPYAYSTVETIVPRMLSNRPRILFLPRDEEAMGNVDNMKLIVDAQQEQMRSELVWQDAAKDGLIYGLGVTKTGWCKESRAGKTLEMGQYGDKWVEAKADCGIDDAWIWRVDPFNFFWDPYADSIELCEWVIHRTWRSPSYVERMVMSGKWRGPSTGDWLLEDILAGGPVNKLDDVMQDRLRAEGMDVNAQHGDQLHEVWEFHNREQVITILDSTIPVQVGENPAAHGDLPFQVYRPTKVAGRMIGIGEIEPIKHLQYEINTLRSQRRYAAKFALMQAYAFDESVIDADDLKIGPGTAIPVNGAPKDFLYPLPLKDVPGSGYSEEQAIQGDLDRTSGISDAVTGASGEASQTATGVQLVQSAAGKRIENKTRRVEAELIQPAGVQILAENQHKILTSRPMAIAEMAPGETVPSWRMTTVGPNELRGRMAVSVEGGSTAAENTPQMRQDAQFFMSLLGTGLFDEQKLAAKVLELGGIKQPEAFVKPPEPQIPASDVEAFLTEAGIPPEMFMQWMEQQDQEGPGGPQEGSQEPEQLPERTAA